MAPDFEDEMFFESKEEAIDHWYNILKAYGWDKQMIANSVEEVDLPDMMGDML